jgi:general secretion pathway protein E
VFSTLHTNDAPGAITRMLDMGVEPFLISSSLLAIMAQRLVRTLCVDCRVPGEISDEQCRELGISAQAHSGQTIYSRSVDGCKSCQFSGYHGRTGIHEVLVIDDAVRSQIMSRADSTSIRAASVAMRSLRADGAAKVLAGITSFEEILRVTLEDELSVA